MNNEEYIERLRKRADWWQERAFEELTERVKLELEIAFMELKKDKEVPYERYLVQHPLDWPYDER